MVTGLSKSNKENCWIFEADVRKTEINLKSKPTATGHQIDLQIKSTLGPSVRDQFWTSKLVPQFGRPTQLRGQYDVQHLNSGLGNFFGMSCGRL